MASGDIVITLPEDLPPETLEAIVRGLPEGTGVSVADAGAAAADGSFDAAFEAAISAAPGLGAAFADWSGRVVEATGGTGPGLIILLALLIAALAYGVEYGLVRTFAKPGPARELPTYQARLWEAVRHGFRLALRLVLFAALARVLVLLIMPGADEARQLGRLVLASILTARAVYIPAQVLFRPKAAGARPASIDDAGARKLMRAMLILIVVAIPAMFVRGLIVNLVEAGSAGVLAATALTTFTALALAWFFLHIRTEIGGLIIKALTMENEKPSSFALFLSRQWHWIYIGFAVINGLFAVRRLLASGARENIASMPMLILVVAPFVIAGIVGWRREAQQSNARAVIIAALALAQGLVAVAAAALLLQGWGLPITREPDAHGLALIVPSLVRAAAMVAVGYAIWIAASVTIGETIGDDDKADDGEIPDESSVQGGSRLETIAPILRGFAVATIGVVTALLALSALGVEIAPLLAGAGVLGLAIGFGAQKLVADIISGVFYLYEDSFRIGEYIVTDEGKGVVEKISLRSVRLRHHRGPVYTISFSSMGTIQNHSRDWVKVKFQFQVPSDTDLEMVRKLVKKVGVQLQEDPELEGMFLEPLKSQGAVDIQGRAYVIGCKYTTKPGQQFTIRRKAFAALQAALREKGVELFAPRIMFQTTDDADALANAVATNVQGSAPAA